MVEIVEALSDSKVLEEVADEVVNEWKRRKRDRSDLERAWNEVDRQVAMIPDVSHKVNPATGQVLTDRAWMAEVELPLQAETLEITTADVRRMKFPELGLWFKGNAVATDDYFARVESTPLIAGDRSGQLSVLSQEDVDHVCSATMEHWHRQFDFKSTMDRIDAESIKYGMGVGRARMAKRGTMARQSRFRDDQIPVLVPRCIKQTYLDDRLFSILSEGHIIGPSIIYEEHRRVEDLQLAAAKGSQDTDDPDGGWMPEMLANMVDHEDKDRKGITTIELEGDIVLPRTSEPSLYIPGAIISIAIGTESAKSDMRRVFRFRITGDDEPSYILFPYHHESIETDYATSPLMKGRPIQYAASQALCRLMDSGMLNILPPLKYDPEDPHYQATGGPVLHPGAQIKTMGDAEALKISDPNALLQVYLALLQQYQDVTATHAPRMGQTTRSHTTAFAKDAELARGSIRTVDYARASLQGPMTQWLNKAWHMGRRNFTSKSWVWIDAYSMHVEVRKSVLPEHVFWQGIGAAGPQEASARDQRKLAAFQMAAQMDQVAIQVGQPPSLNYKPAIEETLRDGGWANVEVLMQPEQPAQPQSAAQPGAALTALAGGAGQ